MTGKRINYSLISAGSLIVTCLCFLVNELVGLNLWFVILICLVTYATIEWRKLPKQCYFLALVTACAALLLYRSDGLTLEAVQTGINRSAFYALFITSFIFMGMAAKTSSEVKRCSDVVLVQPPGRRYVVLTFASHLLAPLLSVGTSNLMGTIVKMATTPSDANSDPTILAIRKKRMTTAVMRGVSTITFWSPTTIIVGVLLATTPSLVWGDIALPGLITAMSIMLAGWLFDWVTRPNRQSKSSLSVDSDYRRLKSFLPLVFLVLVILLGSTLLEHLLGIRQIIALLICVIVCSLIWLMIQGGGLKNAIPHMAHRLKSEFVTTFTNPRAEVVIVTFAGLLGVFVSQQVSVTLLAGIVDWMGFAEAGTLIAISIVILITANLGITPLITIALAAESIWLIPDMQFTNQAVVLCFTATWVVYTMTSPMALQVRLLASSVGESTFDVGIIWNGLFSLGVLTAAYAGVYALS